MEDSNILVSIIIPTYKRSTMLPRAIRSVLNQTYEQIQVVVVDDNDPESEWRNKTEQIMEQFKDCPKVKYIQHKKNQNGSVARNTGIAKSDGQIVSFLDDDDEYYLEKVSEQVEFLIMHPEFHAVYCGWDRDGYTIPYKQGDLSFEILSGTNLIYTNAIMMWKKDAVECGGWDETFVRHQEAAFMLKYFRNGGKIGVVSKVFVKFDTSDRSNAANPKKNEIQTMYYLKSYQDMMDRCEKMRKGASKDIYSYRFRGMFLYYVLSKEYKGAFNVYLKALKMLPVKFNFDLLRYIYLRLRKGGK